MKYDIQILHFARFFYSYIPYYYAYYALLAAYAKLSWLKFFKEDVNAEM